MTLQLSKQISLVSLTGEKIRSANLVASNTASYYDCKVEITFGDHCISATHDDFWHALIQVRKELEAVGYLPALAGACENVSMSHMMADMGRGVRAYVIELGKQAHFNHTVDTFDQNLVGKLATVEAQAAFKERWIASDRKHETE